MPLAPDTAAVAATHQTAIQSLATAAAQAAAAAWAEVDPTAVASSWLAQIPAVTAAVAGAQLAAAGHADAYLDEILDVQGIDAATDLEVDPAAYAGIASDGRPLASLLVQPALTVLAALASRAGRDRAMAAGAATLDMITRTQVVDAGRAADGVALTARPAAQGYTRLLTPPSCARCVILAGRWYRWSAGFARHPRCDCVHVPGRRSDALDPASYFRALSAAEQARIFGRAGAQAIRDGADIAQVVNARSGMYIAGGRRLTTVGTSRRGLYGGYEIDPETGRLTRRAAGAKVPARLMPEEIHRLAGDDRDQAVRLLRRYGYLKPSSAAVSRRTLVLAADQAEDLNALTVAKLKELAKQRGVKIPSGSRKTDIVRLLGGAGDDLDGKTVAQLRELARQRGVKVLARDRKADIVAKLRAGGAGKQTAVLVDPAKATVAQLRQLARDNGVRIPSGLRKADIVAHIRSWEAGNNRRLLTSAAAPKKTASAVSPPTVPRPGRRPGANLPHEITGGGHSWRTLLAEDTGWDPVPVRNLEVPGGGGYVMKSGAAYRIDGVVYLVEDGATGAGPFGLTREKIVDEFREVHAQLPEASRYQRGYAWLAGRNPADEYWARQYNQPGFRSAATAGDGGVRMWGRAGEVFGPAGHFASLSHEFGHNLSRAARDLDLDDHSPAWGRATDRDRTVRRPTDIGYSGPLMWRARNIRFDRDPGRGYPYGVSDYGKSSVMEDYAESVAFYLADVLGEGRLQPGGPLVPIYFRDLFPARAAVLDRLFPSIARRQQAAIQARAG